MIGSKIREKLHRGECVYGTHMSGMMNPMAAKIAATQIDLDFAFFCTEHMPLDRKEVSALCHLYSSHGISPIVRVPSPDFTSISIALDGGAEGIVVPYVETVEEVQNAAAAVRYRPLKGKVLRDVMANPLNVDLRTQNYLKDFNQDKYLIIGVESVPAIENLENLITSADVDGVFLGPHDITTSMGIPEEYNNLQFLKTIEDVIRRCRRHSIGVGMHTILHKLGKDTLNRFFRAGMNWIINGADITVMCDAMTTQLHALRKIAEDIAIK